MQITELFSITELSRLTGKSRPTLYKYLSDYESGKNGDLPPLFFKLFQMIEKDEKKSKIESFCKDYFTIQTETNPLEEEIIQMIQNSRGKIDLKKLKKYIEEETKQ